MFEKAFNEAKDGVNTVKDGVETAEPQEELMSEKKNDNHSIQQDGESGLNSTKVSNRAKSSNNSGTDENNNKVENVIKQSEKGSSLDPKTDVSTGTVKTDNNNASSKDGKEGSSSENKENDMIGGTANRAYNSPFDIIRQGSQVIAEQKALREAQKKDPNYRSTTKKISDSIKTGFNTFKDMAMGNRNKDKE